MKKKTQTKKTCYHHLGACNHHCHNAICIKERGCYNNPVVANLGSFVVARSPIPRIRSIYFHIHSNQNEKQQ